MRIPVTRTPSPEQAGSTCDQPIVLTPSTTAPSSDRAVSPLTFDNFPSRIKGAKAAHYKRVQIFSKTREVIYHKAKRLSILASRGYQRGYLPTKHTKPSLTRRRYSIDVLVNGRAHFLTHGLEHENTEKGSRQKNYHQTDPDIDSAPLIMLPNASRYAGWGTRLALYPPQDTNIYLELGDATIRNDAFNYISVTDTFWGLEVWMRDESIDMALEVLRLDTNCDAHRIGIASSNVAQICHFVCMAKDEASAGYDEYRVRFRDKRWIFMVINDAIGGVTNEGTSGTHWSLIVIDRHHRRVHYIDSLWINSKLHQTTAFNIAHGMLRILGDTDPSHIDWIADEDSPNQNRDNLARDGGACGPFVYKMTDTLIRHIKSMQAAGREREVCFHLGVGFPQQFGSTFDSQRVRYHIQHSIARWKAMIDAARLVYEHDQVAVQDEDVALLDEPSTAFNVPPAPIYPAQHEPPPTNRHGSAQVHTPSPSPETCNVITITDSDEDSLLHEAGEYESDLETQPAQDIELDEVEYNWVVDDQYQEQDLTDVMQTGVTSYDVCGLVEESLSTNNTDEDDKWPAESTYEEETS